MKKRWAKTKPVIMLTLQNSTTDVLPVSILGDPNPGDISNQATVYNWDISGVVFPQTGVSITSWPVGNPAAFNVQTYPGIVQSAGQLITILNSFSIAGFWLSSTGSVKTAIDTAVFSNLTIGAAGSAVQWTGNLITPYTVNITLNAVTVGFFFGTLPSSGQFSAASGDTVAGNVFCGLAPSFTILVQRTLKVFPFTVQLVSTITGSPALAIAPFITDPNYNYTITISLP